MMVTDDSRNKSLQKIVLLVLLSSILSVLLIGCASKPDEATQLVIDEINELENAESVSLEDLEKAKERYNSLTDSQKEKVTNYATLLKLEDNYEEVGKIALTSENYSEYLMLGYDMSFFTKKGSDERRENDVYKNMEVVVASQGISDEYEFDNVTIDVKIGGGYYPLSELSGSRYGLRAGTEYVPFDKTLSFSCDNKGIGSNSTIIEVSGTKYGDGAFAPNTHYAPEITLTVTNISGTVLPKKQ